MDPNELILKGMAAQTLLIGRLMQRIEALELLTKSLMRMANLQEDVLEKLRDEMRTLTCPADTPRRPRT